MFSDFSVPQLFTFGVCSSLLIDYWYTDILIPNIRLMSMQNEVRESLKFCDYGSVIKRMLSCRLFISW